MEHVIRNSGKLLLVLAFSMIFTMAMPQDNKAILAAFSQSYTHETAGEYTKAVEELKKVYDEHSYEINVRLGWLTYKSGLFTESTAYYQKAMNLKPFSIEAKIGFVNPAGALGNWEQVKNQYIEILKIDANNTLINYRLGLLYYGKQDYTNALKHFEKVINLYPFDYDSVIMYAWSNFKLGRLREAKVLFNKALMMRPDDSSALEGIGLIK